MIWPTWWLFDKFLSCLLTPLSSFEAAGRIMVLEQSPYVASAALEISRKIPATNGESFDGLEVY